MKKFTYFIAFVLIFTSEYLLANLSAANPKFIANYRDWYVYTLNNNEGKICYVQSSAKDAQPSNVNHGQNYFLISSFKNKNIVNQPSVKFGYDIKQMPLPTIKIDTSQWKMFAVNNYAYIDLEDEEKSLVNAMKKGSDLVIEAVSARGTAVSYRYSLLGITAALKRASSECY